MGPVSGTGSSARPAPLRVIVTRPATEARLWVEALQAQGWPALALPLIEIGPPTDEETRLALVRARNESSVMDALFFVSGAAVRHFFDAGTVLNEAGAGPRYWAPGPGTARALIEQGVDASQIDAPPDDAVQFDSEALWAVVGTQVRAGSCILIVRGRSREAEIPLKSGEAEAPGNGRNWLIRQCQALGAQVSACVAYERRAPALTPDQRQWMEAAGTRPGSVWLFSSSEALTHLVRACPQLTWRDSAALVTHPRIAEAAHAAGFGQVVETRPAMPDVLRTLESVWSTP